MKKIFLTTFTFITLSVTAQKAKDAATTFASSITAADLKKHLYIVAGKEMEGRETATEGQRKAAAYIENYFKGIGLTPGNNGNYQMPFPVYKDENISGTISINEKAYTNYTDFSPVTYINHAAQQFFSEIVFVGHGLVDSGYNDYDYTDVRGKVILLLQGKPLSFKQSGQRTYGVSAKALHALEHGAAAVLIISDQFPLPNNIHDADEDDMFVDRYKKTQLPNTYLISEKMAADIIGSGWNSIKTKGINEQVTPKIYPANIHLAFNKETVQLQSSNVLAIVEGSDLKDEYVFITAHYDHLGKRDTLIYYGADDDGSGTVTVLEIAEAFKKAKDAGNGPRRTMVFMTVSGEEKGLWGSEYYSDHPIFPLNKTSVDLNIDMIGRSDIQAYRKKADADNYIYIVGDDKLSTELKPLTIATNKKYTKLNLDYKYNDPKDPERIYFRSDHYNFAKNGVPIIFYFDGLHGDYHRTTDTPDKINYKLLEKRARLVFYTAWEMANRNEMMKRDLKLPEQKR